MREGELTTLDEREVMRKARDEAKQVAYALERN
jgi:hypothetical protein